MSELLIELFSEEIPARMQGRAAADLKKMVQGALIEAGYMAEGIKAFATPRRLTLVVTGLPAAQADRKEEKKGPRVGAPEQALAGFLKGAGLASVDECEIRDVKGNDFYFAVTEQKGKPTADVVAGFMPDIITKFPWPKSMRWGNGELKWVRPLHHILCCYDHEVVPFEIAGIQSGDVTHGHRFMAPAAIQTRNFEDYESKLRRAKVILDTDERKERILEEARGLCQAQGLELIEDAGLLEEVAGLAEWPVVLIGRFEDKFLSVPDEALIASMKGHQKYFSVRDPKTGRLAAKFVCVANMEAPDGGAAMKEGYERVLTARLSDAYFQYQTDLKIPLAEQAKKLANITYFEGLGSVADKVTRVAALAREIAPLVGANEDKVELAAKLAKADLVTEMVGEYASLQGVMGRYYALEEGIDADIADAIRDHYKPAGQSDSVPTAPISVAVALAEKMDTLTGFWSINEKPTGSKDPFALRRAALGVIQIILENENKSFLLRNVFAKALDSVGFSGGFDWAPKKGGDRIIEIEKAIVEDLLSFFHDRLKVYLKDKGHAHDHIEAVLTKADGSLEDDFVLIAKKLAALEAFLKTDEGANLTAAYKRATNILKAEEKKGDLGALFVDEARLEDAAEILLHKALAKVSAETETALEKEDFEKALAALSKLRGPLDAFFEDVTVNADAAALRQNRLAMLLQIRTICGRIAQLGKIKG